jgi:hypothetical protein
VTGQYGDHHDGSVLSMDHPSLLQPQQWCSASPDAGAKKVSGLDMLEGGGHHAPAGDQITCSSQLDANACVSEKKQTTYGRCRARPVAGAAHSQLLSATQPSHEAAGACHRLALKRLCHADGAPFTAARELVYQRSGSRTNARRTLA